MFKFALVALTVLNTIIVSASSCGNCSPQCLDCRIRGYSRLSDDQSTADCYLEYVVGGGAPGPICPAIGNATLGTPVYDGTPVCRRQRCTLENGERCRLKRLNEDTCMSLISTANSALDPSLDGCFAYIQNIPFNFTCQDGYTPACRYAGIPDTLPTGNGGGGSKSAELIDTSTNVLSPSTVYTVIPDSQTLEAQAFNPLVNNTTFCPNTMIYNGFVLEFITSGCLEVTSSFLQSDISALLNGKTCNPGFEPLVVNGLFGCYLTVDIPDPNQNLCVQLNSCSTSSTTTANALTLTTTLTLTITTSPSGGAKASHQVGAPIYVDSFPKCYYRLQDNDVDPAGCQNLPK